MLHDWVDLKENSPPTDSIVTWECRRCGHQMMAMPGHFPNERWGKDADCEMGVVRKVLEA